MREGRCTLSRASSLECMGRSRWILTWKIDELKLDWRRAALRFPLVTNLRAVQSKVVVMTEAKESVV